MPLLQERAKIRRTFTGTLLGWRSGLGFGWFESIILALYVLVLAVTISYHEPWADEAQAWVIARDNSVWQILRYRLHYEGSPGLWHLILHFFQGLGGRYGAIDWLGGSFATAGIVVLLRWSPFPLLIRILLPFTFFLQYQYAVIGRGYTLFPLCAFSLCALFYSRRSPLWFALVGGLLANISLQGTVFSFFLMGLYLFQRVRTSASESIGGRPIRSGLLRPAALYFAFFCAAALTAVPAPDCGFATGATVTTGFMHDVLLQFPGLLPQSEKLPIPPPLPLHPVLLPPPPQPVAEVLAPQPDLLSSPGAWAAWYIHHDQKDAQGRVLPPAFTRPMLEVTLELLSLATGPVSTLRLLACAFLLTLVCWLWVRRTLRMLLPWLANIIVGEALWIADHHTGMLFIALLTAIWLSIQAPTPHTSTANSQDSSRKVMPAAPDRSLIGLLALICGLQITWTIVSVRNDLQKTYDPGSQSAAYLLQHSFHHMAAFDFVAVSVQPFFTHNPFYNLRHSYWVWAVDDNANGAHYTTIEQHPDAVLFSQDLLEEGFMHNDWAPLSPVTADTQARDVARNPIVLDLEAHGYHETHRFCGDRFMRLSASYRACHLIFEPAPATEH